MDNEELKTLLERARDIFSAAEASLSRLVGMLHRREDLATFGCKHEYLTAFDLIVAEKSRLENLAAQFEERLMDLENKDAE